MLHARILKHEAQKYAVLKNSQVLLLLIQELHFEDHCLVQFELNQTLHSKESGGSSPQGTSNWTVPPESSFPHSSVGKEFACNAGDPSLIPGSGRSPREGIGYPLQYSWASLVADMVKNLPAMRETWVRFLGLEDPLEKGKATHSSILAWRIPRTV